MNILSIETSCDETAISIMGAKGDTKSPIFSILANNLISQMELHKEFGGVYPDLARREHAKNLPILLEKTLKDASFLKKENNKISEGVIKKILTREPEMTESLLEILVRNQKPPIDYIAVTVGPGLEPALWVGVTFAKALAVAWNIPLIPVNHMEGHIFSVFLNEEKDIIKPIPKFQFPILSLLISGGHTQLVLIKKWGEYEVIGETRDDAVGEAFDKVARILGLPYPGGPEISKLAKEGKENKDMGLPRPMIQTKDYNFSFSGLKTAVLYLVKRLGNITEQDKKDIAKEFQTAVGDVFIHKLKKAIEEFGVGQIIIAGGVVANTYLRERFEEELNVKIILPKKDLATDNSLMIGIAAYFNIIKNQKMVDFDEIRADGNLSL